MDEVNSEVTPGTAYGQDPILVLVAVENLIWAGRYVEDARAAVRENNAEEFHTAIQEAITHLREAAVCGPRP